MHTAKITASIIVGYNTKVRDPKTVRNHIEPVAPGNLRKPESIQAWKDDAEKQEQFWDQVSNLAAGMKLTGAVDRVVAVDILREDIFDSSMIPAKDAGTSFVNWLMDSYTFPAAPGTNEYPVTFYGFNPKPLLRLAGMNAVRSGVHVPLGLWYSGGDHHVLDPQQMLLDTEVKKFYPLSKICDEAPGGGVLLANSYQVHADPMVDLLLTTELCLRYKLLPSMADVQLHKLVRDQPKLRLPLAVEEPIEPPEPTEPTEDDKETDQESPAANGDGPVATEPTTKTAKKKTTKKKPVSSSKK